MTLVAGRSVIDEDVERILADLPDPSRNLAGTTVLVTGAAGFLCSYIVETVAAINAAGLNPPCRVIAVDNLITGVSKRLGHLAGRPDVRFLEHDITRPLDLGERVDWIIHGASIASPTFYRLHPLETIDANVGGIRRMLDLAREHGARGVLSLSSSEIYGDPVAAAIPTPETYLGNVSCTGPRACYDESKRLGETLCATYARLYGTPVKVVRPFNVYGPGQRLDDKRIIPDLMSAALERRPIVLFSDGRATRAFCYVTDAIRAIWHILVSGPPGEAFNVGNDAVETSILDVAETLRNVAGPPDLEIELRLSKDRDYLTDNPQRRCPNLTKLRALCDWQPKVPLAEGLERTLRSYEERTA
ncbi:MAG: NAD-dependent epimerase/dehydratase family protein [Gemmatimonadaceae bacterium]